MSRFVCAHDIDRRHLDSCAIEKDRVFLASRPDSDLKLMPCLVLRQMAIREGAECHDEWFISAVALSDGLGELVHSDLQTGCPAWALRAETGHEKAAPQQPSQPAYTRVQA